MANEAPKTCAVGGEGSGKTALQRHYSKNEKWLLALEPNNKEVIGAGTHRVYDQKGVIAAMRKLIAAKSNGKPYRVTYHVQRGDCPRAALDVAAKCVRIAGGLPIFIDETEYFIPSTHKLSPEVYEIAKRARHETPTKLYLTTHSPMGINREFRRNMSKWMFFFAEDSGTIDFLVKEKRIFHKREEIDKLLLSLKDYDFLESVKRKPLKKVKKIKMS